jgi:hypothetical protein
MNAQRLDVSAVLTTAVSELVTAAQEYLIVSRPLSEECGAAQTRLENALSQFGGVDPYVQAEEIRGMPGRIRELETDMEALSGQLEAQSQRFSRIRQLLFLTGDFAVDQGPDPVAVEVKERMAELEALKRGKRRSA